MRPLKVVLRTTEVVKKLAMHNILRFPGSEAGTKSHQNKIVFSIIQRNLNNNNKLHWLTQLLASPVVYIVGPGNLQIILKCKRYRKRKLKGKKLKMIKNTDNTSLQLQQTQPI